MLVLFFVCFERPLRWGVLIPALWIYEKGGVHDLRIRYNEAVIKSTFRFLDMGDRCVPVGEWEWLVLEVLLEDWPGMGWDGAFSRGLEAIQHQRNGGPPPPRMSFPRRACGARGYVCGGDCGGIPRAGPHRSPRFANSGSRVGKDHLHRSRDGSLTLKDRGITVAR